VQDLRVVQFASPLRQLLVKDSYDSGEYRALGKSLRSVETFQKNGDVSGKKIIHT
jgi:hypothetical protein